MVSRRLICRAAAALPLAYTLPSLAAPDDVHLEKAELLRVTDDISPGLYLSLDWQFELTQVLLESLRRGIVLYFTYEFRLNRTRWYWFDKTVVQASLSQWIGYSPLSRQYRLSQGGLTQSFPTLEEVLPLLSHIRDWRVANLNAIDDIGNYAAEVQMRLDLSKLPKPLQVTVGGNSDWALSSSWEPIALTPQLTHR